MFLFRPHSMHVTYKSFLIEPLLASRIERGQITSTVHRDLSLRSSVTNFLAPTFIVIKKISCIRAWWMWTHSIGREWATSPTTHTHRAEPNEYAKAKKTTCVFIERARLVHSSRDTDVWYVHVWIGLRIPQIRSTTSCLQFYSCFISIYLVVLVKNRL